MKIENLLGTSVPMSLAARLAVARRLARPRLRRASSEGGLSAICPALLWHGLPAREDTAKPALSEVEGMAVSRQAGGIIPNTKLVFNKYLTFFNHG